MISELPADVDDRRYARIVIDAVRAIYDIERHTFLNAIAIGIILTMPNGRH